MNGLGGFLIGLFIFLLGMGAEYIRDSYYSSRAPKDTVQVIRYVPQVPVLGTAKPVKRQKRPRTPQGDASTFAAKLDTLEGYVRIPQEDYDSLKAERTWEIKEEDLGTLTLWYLPTLYPSSEFPSYFWEPAPIKIERIEVIREVPISFSDKAEIALYGVAAGIILTLLLR